MGVASLRVGQTAWSAAPLLALALSLGACAPDLPTAPRPARSTSSSGTTGAVAPATADGLVDEPVVLAVPTYDGSGESVHPDIVAFDAPWHGARYWLTVTPYARSDSRLENPSLLAGDDGLTWRVPSGAHNPVIPHQGLGHDYNSDPELLYDAPRDRLTLVYRFVTPRRNVLLVTSSGDGRHWRPARRLVNVSAHAAVSPSLDPGDVDRPARLWTVNAGAAGCNARTTTVELREPAAPARPGALGPSGLADVSWGAPATTDLHQPGYVVWHLKVRYVPARHEYWALYAAYRPGPAGCHTNDLFLARSVDGRHWQTGGLPILAHADRAWTAGTLYRSTFTYDPAHGQLRVWLSARDAGGHWRLGLARFDAPRLLRSLAAGGAPPAVTGAARWTATTPPDTTTAP